ncbi:MAG: hypothetical protein AAGH99_07220 [Planctomycetota bacterium]
MRNLFGNNALWIIALLGVAVLVAGYVYQRSATNDLSRATAEQSEAMALINQLRLAKGDVGSTETSSGLAETAFIPRIESALEGAGIAMTTLRSVTPRIDRSGGVSYRMVMTPVALAPAANALQRLVGDRGARVTTLALRADNSAVANDAGAERWRIEAEILDPTGTAP